MRYDESIETWLEELPSSFDTGPIGTWELVPAGRDGFGLEGDALLDFIGRAVRRLLEFGARPVKREKGGPYYWALEKQLGDSVEEIFAAVVDEVRRNSEDLDQVDLWFATPDMWAIPNQPIDKWIDALASRLDRGPVSLSEITLTARADYDLAGADLLGVARDAMRRLLERGARPVRTSLEGTPEWIPLPDYGETVEEVLNAVTAEWTRNGVDGLLRRGFAFALPRDA